MKRLKTLKPAKSAGPAKTKKLMTPYATRLLLGLAIGTVLGLAMVAVHTLIMTCIKNAGPHGTITDSERIATYDAEFADFIGPDHNIVEYRYVDSRISQKLDLGYGPLYDVAGYQVIVGETGAVGAITYGNFSYGKWQLHHSPASDWSTAFILVFDGCVAPQEWWSRPVLTSMLYGVPTTDGQYLPELMVWVPWPGWFDFDNPPDTTTFQAQSWYWNGERYVPSHFVDNQFPLFADSQISITAPARGLSPYL